MTILTLQPDAAAGKDTRIRTGDPGGAEDQNNGAATQFQFGHYVVPNLIDVGLIQFDLSSIPSSAIISTATLTLTLLVDGSTYAANGRTARAYRILQAWVEGTGIDSWPADGATWNDYDWPNDWQAAGCSGANDVEAADIGSHTFATTDLAASTHDFNLTVSKVQEWVSGALTNKGLKIQMDTEVSDCYSCASSDHATEGYRPKLVIEYTMPSGGYVAIF